MAKLSKFPLPKFTAEIVGSLDAWVELNKAEIAKGVGEAVEEHAQKVLADAQALVPVDQGLLKGSLHVRLSKDKLRATVRTDAKKAPHGHLVHHGTVKMPGRPFLYQANEKNAPDFKPLVESKIKRG